MKVDYVNSTIKKPAGKRTPAKTIGFDELKRYINIFQEVVDVKSPTEAIAMWAKAGYPEALAMNVLHSVIVSFGGGHRIWGRFQKAYAASISNINSLLSEAYVKRDADANQLLGLITQIKGLGGLAYSTKMLRFLNANHVVLDSILREEFCLIESDYSIFANHCREIAATLGVTPVDVESGLYAYVQIANPNQRLKDWNRYRCK